MTLSDIFGDPCWLLLVVPSQTRNIPSPSQQDLRHPAPSYLAETNLRRHVRSPAMNVSMASLAEPTQHSLDFRSSAARLLDGCDLLIQRPRPGDHMLDLCTEMQILSKNAKIEGFAELSQVASGLRLRLLSGSVEAQIVRWQRSGTSAAPSSSHPVEWIRLAGSEGATLQPLEMAVPQARILCL